MRLYLLPWASHCVWRGVRGGGGMRGVCDPRGFFNCRWRWCNQEMVRRVWHRHINRDDVGLFSFPHRLCSSCRCATVQLPAPWLLCRYAYPPSSRGTEPAACLLPRAGVVFLKGWLTRGGSGTATPRSIIGRRTSTTLRRKGHRPSGWVGPSTCSATRWRGRPSSARYSPAVSCALMPITTSP